MSAQVTAPAPAQAQAEHKLAANGNPNAALLTSILDRETEFVPFMGKDPIKLSARLVMKFLCTPTKSGAVCDERMAIRFVMMCKARGLNPWEGDAYIIGYDAKDGPTFSLVTAHQAFLKRAEVHPEYDGMTSGVIVARQGGSVELDGDYFDDGDSLVGGWACVHFKNRKHPMKKRLKLSTFHQGRSRWNADPAGMIVKCAEADALRSAFPNTLGGMFLADEMPDVEPIGKPGREPVPMPRAIGEPIKHVVRDGAGEPVYDPPEELDQETPPTTPVPLSPDNPPAAQPETKPEEDLDALDRQHDSNMADQLRAATIDALHEKVAKAVASGGKGDMQAELNRAKESIGEDAYKELTAMLYPAPPAPAKGRKTATAGA